MRILVLGANGQLGQEFQLYAAKLNNLINNVWIFADRLKCNLSDPLHVKNFLSSIEFDILINCAAYTKVDLAEKESSLCQKINADALFSISNICLLKNALLIHYSTDYVFDGNSSMAYKEDHPAHPLNEYGRTKFSGEQIIQQSGCQYFIIRTSWVYGRSETNFVQTIIKKSLIEKKLNLVCDQIGTPTWVFSLMNISLELINHYSEHYYGQNKIDQLNEIFHYSNEGVASWYDFAHAICYIQKIKIDLNPIYTKDLQQIAQRPSFSVLNKSKIKNYLNCKISHWCDDLDKMLYEYRQR